jgi:DnaA N-terminal domain
MSRAPTRPILHRSIEMAQPGWVVVVLSSKIEPELFRLPVIAWLFELRQVEVCGRDAGQTVVVTPITCTGEIEDHQDFALQFGDRPQFFTYGATYEDEASVLSFLRECERGKERQALPLPPLPANDPFSPIRDRLADMLGNPITASWFTRVSLEVVGETAQVKLPTRFLCEHIRDNFADQLGRAVRDEYPGVTKVLIQSDAVEAAR